MTETRVLRDSTETAAARGAGRARNRKVLAGEGMLEAIVDFSYEGQRFEAEKSRIVPEHAVVQRFPDRFRPAMEGDETAAVQRFRSRSPVSSSRRVFGVNDPEPWRLRPNWRL